jgi:hypothetical protein
MTRVEEYRHYAIECARIAQLVSKPDEKMHLLEMAQKWSDLAELAARAEKTKSEANEGC